MRTFLQGELQRLGIDEGKYARRKILLCSNWVWKSASVADFFVVYLEGQIIVFSPLLRYSFKQASVFVFDYLDASGKENRLSCL